MGVCAVSAEVTDRVIGYCAGVEDWGGGGKGRFWGGEYEGEEKEKRYDLHLEEFAR